MFKLGIIEESLKDIKVLNMVKQYLFSQRIEQIPEDEYPVWHTNEYHIPDEKLKDLLEILKDEVKETWYIHAFNDKQLFVVLKGRYFMLSLNRDYSWNEMIEYGVNEAKVERRFLENVPLHV